MLFKLTKASGENSPEEKEKFEKLGFEFRPVTSEDLPLPGVDWIPTKRETTLKFPPWKNFSLS